LRFNPLKGKGLVVENNVKTKLLGDLRMKYDVGSRGCWDSGLFSRKNSRGGWIERFVLLRGKTEGR
jgi:hypothetical protein